jgi:hypothetical protein
MGDGALVTAARAGTARGASKLRMLSRDDGDTSR